MGSVASAGGVSPGRGADWAHSGFTITSANRLPHQRDNVTGRMALMVFGLWCWGWFGPSARRLRGDVDWGWFSRGTTPVERPLKTSFSFAGRTHRGKDNLSER